MNCPNCHHQISDDAVLSAAAKISVSRRKNNVLPQGEQLRRGGRKPVPTSCPRCKELQPSAIAAFKHCRRIRKPSVR